MSDTTTDIKKKPIGNLSSLDVNLNDPKGIKLDITSISHITLFIGANGTGKTFTLVTTYCMGSIAALLTSELSGVNLIVFSNDVFNRCFENMDFTGYIKAVWSSGAEIVVDFNEGSVCSVNHSGFEDKQPYGVPRFLSSNMRLFTALKGYLTTRKYIAKEVGSNQALIASKMVEAYKLYDVTQMEFILSKLPWKVTPEFNTFVSHYDLTDPFIEISVDFEKGEVYGTTEGNPTPKSFTTYGNGHQAILMMALGTFL